MFIFPAGAETAFPGYPDPDVMYQEIYDLARAYPDWATIQEYGRSVQDRPLLALRIAKPDGKARPQALIAANIHGDEWIGNRMALAVAKRLLESKDSDPWIASLLDRIEFWVLPCLNPDGYAYTWSVRDKGGDHVRSRKNANGVDLNRNFPLPGKKTLDIKMAGSDRPEDETYGGTEPYSEPETRSLRDFLAGHEFFAAVDFHSAAGTFFPPKCPDPRCMKDYIKMLDAAREKQGREKYITMMAGTFDTFTGELEDMLYYQHGVMAVCWEIWPMEENKKAAETESHAFWRSNPRDPETWAQNDRDAALAAIEKALELTGGAPLPPERRVVK